LCKTEPLSQFFLSSPPIVAAPLFAFSEHRQDSMDGQQLDLIGSEENTQPLADELSQQQADSGQSQAENA
jgi:hypothetical protein